MHSVVRKQLAGAALLLAASLIVIAVKEGTKGMPHPFFSSPPPLSHQSPASTAVQVVGARHFDGIYFLDSPSTVGDVLVLAAPRRISLFDKSIREQILSPGDRLVLSFKPPTVILERMEARMKLSLGMPLNMTTASIDDLVLIPGIGPVTAESIVAFRDERGSLSSLAELTALRGIGDRRLELLERYLVLDREGAW